MARIDPFIDAFFSLEGQELIFETGSGAYVRTRTGPRPVIKQSLTAQQIIGAIAEIVPAELSQTYPAEGATNFVYGAPSGPVIVRLEKRGGLVRAIIVRSEEPALPPSPVVADPEAKAHPAVVVWFSPTGTVALDVDWTSQPESGCLRLT